MGVGGQKAHFQGMIACILITEQKLWQRWDSNPRPFGLVPKTSALDRSATLPIGSKTSAYAPYTNHIIIISRLHLRASSIPNHPIKTARARDNNCKGEKDYSQTGSRTRATWVRARYPNRWTIWDCSNRHNLLIHCSSSKT